MLLLLIQTTIQSKTALFWHIFVTIISLARARSLAYIYTSWPRLIDFRFTKQFKLNPSHFNSISILISILVCVCRLFSFLGLLLRCCFCFVTRVYPAPSSTSPRSHSGTIDNRCCYFVVRLVLLQYKYRKCVAAFYLNIQTHYRSFVQIFSVKFFDCKIANETQTISACTYLSMLFFLYHSNSLISQYIWKSWSILILLLSEY